MESLPLAIVSVYATTGWMGKTNYLGASTTFVRAAGKQIIGDRLRFSVLW
jgi:hypothetical protein